VILSVCPPSSFSDLYSNLGIKIAGRELIDSWDVECH